MMVPIARNDACLDAKIHKISQQTTDIKSFGLKIGFSDKTSVAYKKNSYLCG